MRRGENRSTRRKTSQSRVENQQTQPTYDAESGNRTRATLVGGECSDTAPTLLPGPFLNFQVHFWRTGWILCLIGAVSTDIAVDNAVDCQLIYQSIYRPGSSQVSIEYRLLYCRCIDQSLLNRR